jgi:hypothetical protein
MRTAAFISAFASIAFCGAIFGFFYAWVCSTMWGLDQTDPNTAIKAMQAMNASVRNAVFAPAFFGTPLVLLVTAGLAFLAGPRSAALFFGLAALVYLAGAFAVTVQVKRADEPGVGRSENPTGRVSSGRNLDELLNPLADIQPVAHHRQWHRFAARRCRALATGKGHLIHAYHQNAGRQPHSRAWSLMTVTEGNPDMATFPTPADGVMRDFSCALGFVRPRMAGRHTPRMTFATVSASTTASACHSLAMAACSCACVAEPSATLIENSAAAWLPCGRRSRAFLRTSRCPARPSPMPIAGQETARAPPLKPGPTPAPPQ